MHYVRNGDVRLAYRVYGDAETTLVWVPTMFSSIDRYDDPSFPWGASSNSCRVKYGLSCSTAVGQVCPTL